jgi:hypothetical protein
MSACGRAGRGRRLSDIHGAVRQRAVREPALRCNGHIHIGNYCETSIWAVLVSVRVTRRIKGIGGL